MQKNYPVLYNQHDYSDPLGDSKTVTIASGGCFDTSLAMKAKFYGIDINPSQLNQAFIDNRVYLAEPDNSANDLLPDNALQRIYENVQYIKTLDYEPIPTDLGNIKTLLDAAPTTLTVRINLGKGNYHFVEAVNCDGHVLHIANPWSGAIEDFSKNYGDPVTAKLHILIYSGPVITPAAPDSPADGQSPLALRFNQAIQKSNNFDIVADYVGITADQRVTASAGLIVVEKIKQLQGSMADLDAENQKLKEQLAQPVPPIPPAVPPQQPLPPQNTQTPSVPTPPITPPAGNGAKFSNGTSPVSGNPPLPSPRGTNEAAIGKKANVFSRILKTVWFWMW